MKKLRIAQVAPLWVPIPPEKYGGIELVVYALTEELVKRGHKVTLFASGDSKTSARLFSVYPRALLKDGIPWKDNAYTLLNLTEAFKRAGEFDIIHSHIDLYDQFFVPFSKTPVVSTMHNNVFADRKTSGRMFVYDIFKKNNFVSISKKQQKNSAAKLNYVANVYNGLVADNYKFNPSPEDKFIWIARIDEVKGVVNAIAAAEKIGARLDIAGRIDPVKEDFFNKMVKPKLNKRIRYVGEIGQPQKNDFFGSAKALLYPIEWEEPFGMVLTEAMACGTPAIAYERGSIKEIVKNGVSGYAVRNLAGMCEAMKKVGKIDRLGCRKYFEENFASEKMADEYEKVYYKILAKNKH